MPVPPTASTCSLLLYHCHPIHTDTCQLHHLCRISLDGCDRHLMPHRFVARFIRAFVFIQIPLTTHIWNKSSNHSCDSMRLEGTKSKHGGTTNRTWSSTNCGYEVGLGARRGSCSWNWEPAHGQWWQRGPSFLCVAKAFSNPRLSTPAWVNLIIMWW